MARDYTMIKAWQIADQLALYKATKEFPKSRVWGFKNQGLKSDIRCLNCMELSYFCLANMPLKG